MIKCPEMRTQLLACLESLSDMDYQKAVWVEHNYPPGIQYGEFDISVHFFYDDTTLSEDPDSWIGYVLLNQKESDAVRALVKEMENILVTYGTKLTDEEYMGKPEWLSLVDKAKEACVVFGFTPRFRLDGKKWVRIREGDR